MNLKTSLIWNENELCMSVCSINLELVNFLCFCLFFPLAIFPVQFFITDRAIQLLFLVKSGLLPS